MRRRRSTGKANKYWQVNGRRSASKLYSSSISLSLGDPLPLPLSTPRFSLFLPHLSTVKQKIRAIRRERERRKRKVIDQCRQYSRQRRFYLIFLPSATSLCNKKDILWGTHLQRDYTQEICIISSRHSKIIALSSSFIFLERGSCDQNSFLSYFKFN